MSFAALALAAALGFAAAPYGVRVIERPCPIG
jgi:hypothetical protein